MSEEMSAENMDLHRKFFAVWNSGDTDAVRALLHPDIIVRGLQGWPEPGPFVGREEFMRELVSLRDAYEVETLAPVGEPREIANHVVFRAVWRGMGEGPDLNMEFSVIVTVRDGTIFGLEYLWDHTEALRAAGLSE